MRLRSQVKVVCAAAALLVLPVATGWQSAAAQGFFESLFGWGGGAKSAPPQANSAPNQGRAGNAPFLTPGGYPYSTYGSPGANQPRTGRNTDDDDDNAGGGNGQKFRTVCVRMCDGFYFPLSFAATRKNFYSDGQRCQSQCGEEGRMFYLPSPDGDMDQAIDLAGRPYSRLPNAFRYRKVQVESCACRPQPWSDAEIARHRHYAEAAARDPAAAKPASDAEVPSKSDAKIDSANDAATKPEYKPTRVKSAERRKPPSYPAVRPASVATSVRATNPSAAASAPGGAMALGVNAKHRWPGD